MTLESLLALPLDLETLHVDANFGPDNDLEQKFQIPWRSLSELHLDTHSFLNLDLESLPSTLQVLDLCTSDTRYGALEHDFRVLTPKLRHLAIYIGFSASTCGWDTLERLPETVTHLQVTHGQYVEEKTFELIRQRAPSFTYLWSNVWVLDTMASFTRLERICLNIELDNNVILPPNLKSLVVNSIESPIILPPSLTDLLAHGFVVQQPAASSGPLITNNLEGPILPFVPFPAGLRKLRETHNCPMDVLRLLPKTVEDLCVHFLAVEWNQLCPLFAEFMNLTTLSFRCKSFYSAFVSQLPRSITCLDTNLSLSTENKEIGRGLLDHTSLTSLKLISPNAESLILFLPPQLKELRVSLQNPLQRCDLFAALPRGMTSLAIRARKTAAVLDEDSSSTAQKAIESLPQGLNYLRMCFLPSSLVPFLPPNLSHFEGDSEATKLYYDLRPHVLQHHLPLEI